jgi:hypothetical protein
VSILVGVAIVIGVVALAAYLLLRFNRFWIYRIFDRALTNSRTSLPPAYELPRYFTSTPSGQVDVSVRWPGWDGWYFFMLPADRGLPVKMVRASLMTGTYGLDGVDNYERLLLRLSTFDVVEHMVLLPTEVRSSTGSERYNYLAHDYLPKAADLTMKPDTLDVAVRGVKPEEQARQEQYGRIQGRWPDYRFEFLNPEAEVRVSLSYHAERILWWADLPGIFTYFAAFGAYEGVITYARGTQKDDPHSLPRRPESFPLRGRGCFEHGFAAKRSNYDGWWAPIRWLQRVAPSVRPVKYHYELFIDNDGLEGGFMLARGFGINFRDRGGLYRGDDYVEIERVRIDYVHGEVDRVANCQGTRWVPFPRAWKVRAQTPTGLLEYTATREWPPAAVSTNMMYYHFAYAGTYRGTPIQGRGYGEYLTL